MIALRRLLIGEAREFPALAVEYFDRAPGQVLEALASGFAHLGKLGLLRMGNAPHVAAQFAYLVAGEPLDRAVLVGTVPPREQVIECAREGVETFLARYGVAPRPREKRMRRRTVAIGRGASASVARCRLPSRCSGDSSRDGGAVAPGLVMAG